MMIEVDPTDAIFQSETGHFAWYSEQGGNAALNYQQTSYQQYLEQLQADIDGLMEK
jgi:hypothetical protein